MAHECITIDATPVRSQTAPSGSEHTDAETLAPPRTLEQSGETRKNRGGPFCGFGTLSS